MRVCRTERMPSSSAATPASRDAARDAEQEIGHDEQDLGAAVGADREESRLPEREQPRVAEQQIEAEREHREDQDLHREIDRIAAGHPRQHEERDDQHATSSAVREDRWRSWLSA